MLKSLARVRKQAIAAAVAQRIVVCQVGHICLEDVMRWVQEERPWWGGE